MLNLIHTLFIFLLLISVLFVITSSNPIEAVLFLVLSFLNAGAILIIFGLEFFALLFIMVYVGAIAILFLFVVMMLNLKKDPALFNNFSFYNLLLGSSVLLILYIIIVEIKLVFQLSLPSTHLVVFQPDAGIESYVFSDLSNITVFGQALYNGFAPLVLLSGILLLISLIGSVLLTLNYNKKKIDTFTKKELSYRQLSRSDKFIKISR